MTERLPIDDHLPEILARLREEQNLVVVAAPGSGKTTRVAPAILRGGILKNPASEILLLQPRRVAARSLALRIAREQGWPLGGEIGYQVRFENKAGPKTRLKLITEGILTRRLQESPFLDGVEVVILDEFHERSIHTDLAIALLRQLQSTRDDLKIVVMSATIDPGPVAEFLGNAAVITAGGRPHPVDVKYLGKTLNVYDFHEMTNAAASAVKAMTLEKHEGPGHILTFLPGTGEINRVRDLLADPRGFDVLPLHGRLSSEDQDRVLAPSEKRKIILSTNVAETSLTIDGVSLVVDSGLARVNRASFDFGIEKLELTRISLASAHQRAGRAGRQYPGRCLRLWTQHDERSMVPQAEPELKRVLLTDTWLFLSDQGYNDPNVFPWFEAPPKPALSLALEQLVALGALDSRSKQITATGRELLRYPLPARLAKLIHSARAKGLFNEAATCSALLSERDIVRDRATLPVNPEMESDLLARLETVDEPRRVGGHEIDSRAVSQVARVREQLGAGPASLNPAREMELAKLIFEAFSDRLCRRRRPGENKALMAGGRGVSLSAQSGVRRSELFVALDIQESRAGGALEGIVRQASFVDPRWIEETFPGEIKFATRTEFDPANQKIFALRARSFRGLSLEDEQKSAPSIEEAASLIGRAAAENSSQIFRPDSEAGHWISRYRFAQTTYGELEWPDLQKEILPVALEELAIGCRSVAELLEKPVAGYLESKLPRALAEIMKKEIPSHLTVPSGSRIRLEYEPGLPPSISVRLQEVFGWTETPRVAGGRVPVTLSLLSPGFKPVQVTSDLNSFWKNAYHEVRKELRARYPRHSWPEDPFTAKPVAKGGRKR